MWRDVCYCPDGEASYRHYVEINEDHHDDMTLMVDRGRSNSLKQMHILPYHICLSELFRRVPDALRSLESQNRCNRMIQGYL